MTTNISSDLQNYLSSSQKSSGSSSGNGFISLNLPTFAGYSKLSTKASDNPFDEEAQQHVGASSRSGSGWFSWAKGKEEPKPETNSCLPEMSRKQRMTGFVVTLLLGALCFVFAFMYLPVLVFKMRKFVLLFSLGSTFTMLSFCFLLGPWNHIKGLFASERILFTSVYLTTLVTTLYFAMGLESTILTTIAGSAQICALLYYVISYIPGGAKGLTYFSSFWISIVSSTVKSCFSS